MILLGLLFACSTPTTHPALPEPPPEGTYAREAWPMVSAAVVALHTCETEAIATLRRSSRTSPPLTAAQVRAACDGVGKAHTLGQPLVGRSRETDQLLSGLARVAEDVRIYELELAGTPPNPTTVKGAVDHIVDSVPQIFEVAERNLRKRPEAFSPPSFDGESDAQIAESLRRVRVSIGGDLRGLTPSLSNLGWSNRSSPQRVRTLSLRHLVDASKARVAEARASLPASPHPDVAPTQRCLQAADQLVSGFTGAVEAYATGTLAEPEWSRWRDEVSALQQAHQNVCRM